MPGVSRSPRPFRARVRRIAGGLAFVALLAAALPQPATAFSDPKLKKAHEQLQRTRDRMHARTAKLGALQEDMNTLATEIFNTYQKIEGNRIRMGKLQAKMKPLRKHLAVLKKHLDQRSREAFIIGPGAPILYLLTATSAAEAASRISLLDEMSRRDAVLAEKVTAAQDTLARSRDALGRAQMANRILLDQLAANRKELKARMEESRRLLALLETRKNRILSQISAVHPFAFCPVDGPHAVTNNFGVWVHRPKKWGGDHIHQGDDIMSPEGAPIVAPFDGTATDATNHIGGIAVKVYGRFGYVYNAHLSRLGRLGEVKAGTVIGYVGHTGDTGANHDHFEWHPNGGPAVDPYDFLMKVC
jgi:murein DD-endopeptidase MepM/ murein hydrolase activator NlpD